MSDDGKQRSLRQVLAQLRKAAHPARRQKAPDVPESTGYTVFGDIGAPLRNLTSEPIEALHEDPRELPGVFKIRLARSRAAQRNVGQLIQRRYSSRGYRIPGLKPDENLCTLVAYRDNHLVGTLGVRVDSPHGLSADDLYPDEVARLRAAGVRLGEFTRLAVEGDKVSLAVLGALFHTAYLYAYRVRGCDCAVIEVNPRHTAYYRRGLSFDPIGPERFNPRVQAPSVLLCIAFERMAANVASYFARTWSHEGGRSAYAHWFPPDEERGVLNRLLQLDAEGSAQTPRATGRGSWRADSSEHDA
ncbi:MAG TPA: long-chain N-acyl amino acid synthase [Casimicrobiaceae bacterium]|nr:long-chain N-acyl amino acid synthase [Casimicrobiaceae bacterium]